MVRLFLVAMLVSIFAFSCEKETDEENIKEVCGTCGSEVIVDSDLYKNAPKDAVVVKDIKVVNDCLVFDFGAGGCDGNSWVVKLIDEGVIMESEPPRRNLVFSLENKEMCDAFISKSVAFNIERLKVDGSRVYLNINNVDKEILYEY